MVDWKLILFWCLGFHVVRDFFFLYNGINQQANAE